MRTQTVHRLAGKVDLMMTGSGWWTMGDNWPPKGLFRRLERSNQALARRAAETFATYVGAPLVHAAHSGNLECRMPWSPAGYRGRFQGGAVITDARGTVLSRRERDEGPGFAIANVTPGRSEPIADPPDRFWLHNRGAVAAAVWNYQRLHGRRWYRRHVSGRPAANPGETRIRAAA